MDDPPTSRNPASRGRQPGPESARGAPDPDPAENRPGADLLAALDPYCSIARSLGVLGDRWTFLILREALDGVTRFAEFREHLGMAANILTARLALLVEAGILDKVPYAEPGHRQRLEYLLTDRGHELQTVLAALQMWGDQHLPRDGGPTVRRLSDDGRALRIAFVDAAGHEVPLSEVRTMRTAQHP